MPLDKLTLHAQLAILTNNSATLDKALAEKTNTLNQLAIDLERTRGARQFCDLCAQQVQNMLAEVERAEKATTPPTPAT